MEMSLATSVNVFVRLLSFFMLRVGVSVSVCVGVSVSLCVCGQRQ